MNYEITQSCERLDSFRIKEKSVVNARRCMMFRIWQRKRSQKMSIYVQNTIHSKLSNFDVCNSSIYRRFISLNISFAIKDTADVPDSFFFHQQIQSWPRSLIFFHHKIVKLFKFTKERKRYQHKIIVKYGVIN